MRKTAERCRKVERVASKSSLRANRPVSAVALLPEDIQEAFHCIALLGEVLDHCLAARADPSPAPCEANLAEQIGFDVHHVKARHVFRRVRAFDVKLVGLCEHASMIARPVVYVQREI